MHDLSSREAVTHRRVLKIALPIVVANATVPILGAVDTGVIGQLGEAAPIGAVGIGAIILTTLYWLFGFLRMGISGLTAQARGRDDKNELFALLIRGLLIAAAGGLFLIALQSPILWLSFVAAPASTDVEILAREYTFIRIWSAPAAISLFAITGWLIALERTRSVLVLQLVTNGINIILDLIFVLALDFGVPGVAFATVIAETCGLVLGLWLCRSALRGAEWPNLQQIFARQKLRKMAAINTDIFVRNLLIEITFVLFLFLAANFGDLTLAANQILIQFLHIAAFALDGFAFAAEALVGLSIGARQRQKLRRSVLLTSLWGGITTALMVLGIALFGTIGIHILTSASDVRAEALIFLPWVIAAPIVGTPSWVLDGIFVGATRTREMRQSMLVSTIIFVIFILILIPLFGNHGLWASLLIFFVTRAITLGSRYLILEADAGTMPDKIGPRREHRFE